MYRKKPMGWTKHLDFIVLDIVCLIISYIVAFLLRFGVRVPTGQLQAMLWILALLDFFVIVAFSTMKNVLKRGSGAELRMTIKNLIILMIVTVLFTFAAHFFFSRLVYGLTFLFYFFLSYFTRIALKSFVRKRTAYEADRSLLVLTDKESLERTVREIKENRYGIYQIPGIVVIDESMTGQEIDGIPILADRNSVIDYAMREWVDEILIATDFHEIPTELVADFLTMGITVHRRIANDLKFAAGDQFVERIGKTPVLTISIHAATAWSQFIKRLMDIIGGLIGCALTGILTVILGPIIYFSDPGPIFFSQKRIGRNGKPFKMYKFRSMYQDAEARKAELADQNQVSDGMMFKIEDDPRIIGCRRLEDGTVKKGIGNFIRDHSLDEFPQFFNVLKGDMSLVGTRPPTVDEWERYRLEYRVRLASKPGITGLWQVSGRSKITDFEKVVELDRQYIISWSLGLDMKILWKTVGAVFRKDGAM